MLNSLILLGGFVSSFGLGAILPNCNIEQKQQVVSNVQPKLVNYDDESYTITLTADELNNYTWDNLVSHLSTLVTNPTVVGYINYGTYTNKSLSWRYDNSSLFYSLQSTFGQPAPMIIFNRLDSGKFLYYETTSSEGVSLTDNLTLVFNSDYYSSFKQAIELDIQANQTDANVLGEFVNILVSSIGQLGTGIANGVSAMASALFLTLDQSGNVTGLSLFGGIIAIFCGLALAIAISTKIYNWVTSLGN